jgi:hypothetical protein
VRGTTRGVNSWKLWEGFFFNEDIEKAVFNENLKKSINDTALPYAKV